MLSVTAGLVLALAAGAALAVNNMCAGNCTGTSKNDRVYGNGGEDWLKGGTDQDVLYGHEDNGQGQGPYGRGHGTRAPGDNFLRGGTADKTNDGARDVIDCGENAGEDETTPDNDADIYTPGVDEINNCENPNPPELE